MARRKRHEEHENHERWLVSYADFITLLFAFFVVMYSISSVNEGKYRVLSETLESVFSQSTRSTDPIQVGELSRGQGERVASPGKPLLPDFEIELPELPNERPPVSEQSIRTINEISQQLSSALADLITNNDVSIKQTDDWLEVEINSNFLFASGDARLAREAVPVIGEIADVLAPVANPLQVEGFTDDQPINTPRFPSNWELSAARAASVVNLLDRFGIEPGRMSAIGYGEFKPIADNETELGRQKNRRVVLVILGSSESRRTLEVFDEQLKRPTSEAATSISPITDSLSAPLVVPTDNDESSP
ncbi:flagellar motor protein MotD [Methylophaga pinxianii]|uniref:flagellar motor protein MotD n=1 Tax=Methylophaga pinxianii TaxID=2881052 RepID=UPI001CF5E455|nr:flagellar motor protein MotD [Methylophaga pinxianii]MCB2426299.1 flagellar motor protein MotD [Methylophaga pinxianii]UPH46694.1 flagellar motor protein MotD [Methylophaga pinxianii]